MKLLSQVITFKQRVIFILEKRLSNFRFINIFGFTCDFNFVLAKEVENVINDDGTFVDSELLD